MHDRPKSEEKLILFLKSHFYFFLNPLYDAYKCKLLSLVNQDFL